jgi:hypothetical protein
MADEWRVSEGDQPLVIDYDLTYGWSYPRRLSILFINILYLFESGVVMISMLIFFNILENILVWV